MSTTGHPTDPILALQAAIALAQSGNRDAARVQLLTITTENPTLELAWMWLATVTDDTAARIEIMHRILAINPANEKVRTALVRLTGDQSSLPSIQKSVPTARATFVSAKNKSGSVIGPRQGLSGRNNTETILIVVLVLAVFIIVVGGGALLLGGRFARPSDTPTATNTTIVTATRPLPSPAKSYTPSVTPGGPTDTPYVLPTLPPSWTPIPTQTSPATYTPLPTDSPIPTETAMSTLPPPSPIPIPTKDATPTLVPLSTLPGGTTAKASTP